MKNLLMLIVNTIIGSVLLVAGSSILSAALEKSAKSRTVVLIKKAGKNTVGAFLSSVAITGAVQSSSAVTALTVSLADSGILALTSAMAVVYGANIGTTVTAQMMSINISSLWPYIICAGIGLKLYSIVYRRLNTGAVIVLSIGLMFSGLSCLSLSTGIMKQSAYIMNFINMYSQKTLSCLFFGFITTALLHSSSATVGMTMALFSGGVISLPQAIAITLGDNIGTCITALVASISSGKRGRQVAWGHMLYNIICAVIVLCFFDVFLNVVIRVTMFLGQGDGYLVANAHTLLNLFGALVFMPVNKWFCNFLELCVKE